ncbi:hypothetical protein [Azospirillum melinis]
MWRSEAAFVGESRSAGKLGKIRVIRVEIRGIRVHLALLTRDFPGSLPGSLGAIENS